jgi:hypothetical protein
MSSSPINIILFLTFSADSQTWRDRVSAQSYSGSQRHGQSTFEHSAEERDASLRWLLAGSCNGSRPQCHYLLTEFQSGLKAVAYGLRLEAGKVRVRAHSRTGTLVSETRVGLGNISGHLHAIPRAMTNLRENIQRPRPILLL